MPSESLKSKKKNLSSLVFILEIALIFTALWYGHVHGLITRKPFFLLMTFASFMLAVYYGIKGAAAGALGCTVLILVAAKEELFPFLSLRYMEAGIFLGALMIVGYMRNNFTRQTAGMDLTNLVLNKRVEKLTVELSERDRALQDAFHEVLADMETPRIMYQGLRRLEHLSDRDAFFDEILYLLYTHCHVEKSGIYDVLNDETFQRVSSFGAGDLPEILRWKDQSVPEIIRVALTEKEVIIPKHLNNRHVMAIPILSSTEVLRFIILLEEIRFINLSENLINLLKVAAFWIKSIIEDRLYRDELLTLSAFSSAIVYKPDISKKVLEESISRYNRYGLPFSLLRVGGAVSERSVGRLSSSLRLYDEIFMKDENELVVFLSMADERNSRFVIRRLSDALPDMSIESKTSQPADHE